MANMTYETYLRQQADKSEYGVTVIQTQIALDIADWIERKRDVKEAVYGEWKPISAKDLTFYCSNCGKVQITNADNFCPNCGADMRGEK